MQAKRWHVVLSLILFGLLWLTVLFTARSATDCSDVVQKMQDAYKLQLEGG